MRMTYHDARAILTVCHLDGKRDFHTLRQDDVARLLVHADARKYRAPRNANGSRARYFYTYLQRVLAKGE